jgi:alpha-L-fucosidase 2
VAGTFDGTALRAYIDGHEVTPRARFIAGGSTGDTIWISRNADGPVDEEYDWPNPLPPARTFLTPGREVTFAARVVGAESAIHSGGIDFTISAGQLVYLVTPIFSDLDKHDHHAAALARAQELTVPAISKLRDAHREWWHQFWAQSFVDFDDPVLEKEYYASEYITASASRDGKVAPGLYGPWVTTDHPSWNSNYTMDYNYETPLLAMYSSNHIAITGSYEQPLIDLIDRGKLYAKTMLNDRGVLYPGNMGPWGMERPFEFEPFMGMKSNAAFAATPVLMHFYSTYDDQYAAEVYPFLLEVGNFWEDDLDRSTGTYHIHKDCANEVGPWLRRTDWDHCPGGEDPTSTLGFVRATFQGLIDISRELGVDAGHRAEWQDILDHLSPYPTTQRSGVTVFLTASDSNANGFGSGNSSWAIWPAGQIGIGMDPKLLAIAKNGFEERPTRPTNPSPPAPPLVNVPNAQPPANPQRNRMNPASFPLAPPAMARVGYDPARLLDDLRENCTRAYYPNGYLFFGGGGVEGTEPIPGAINEMLLQSFSGVLRLFPDWPGDRRATFENLRAYGAFLVSATISDRKVGEVSIVSEKGRDCMLANPWPGQKITVYRNGHRAETLSGAQVTFRTAPGEHLRLQPE